MDKKELSKYIGIVIISMIMSSGATVLLDQDKPIYSCESQGIVSDCVNGIKACDDQGICRRCYYDLENSRKYKVCSEGWKENFITQEKEIQDQVQEIPQKQMMPSTFRQGSYQCFPEGCEI